MAQYIITISADDVRSTISVTSWLYWFFHICSKCNNKNLYNGIWKLSAKVQLFCHILSKQLPKTFKMLTLGRNFAKSGHTVYNEIFWWIFMSARARALFNLRRTHWQYLQSSPTHVHYSQKLVKCWTTIYCHYYVYSIYVEHTDSTYKVVRHMSTIHKSWSSVGLLYTVTTTFIQSTSNTLTVPTK